jgi:hypothetical protein
VQLMRDGKVAWIAQDRRAVGVVGSVAVVGLPDFVYEGLAIEDGHVLWQKCFPGGWLDTKHGALVHLSTGGAVVDEGTGQELGHWPGTSLRAAHAGNRTAVIDRGRDGLFLSEPGPEEDGQPGAPHILAEVISEPSDMAFCGDVLVVGYQDWVRGYRGGTELWALPLRVATTRILVRDRRVFIVTQEWTLTLDPETGKVSDIQATDMDFIGDR